MTTVVMEVEDEFADLDTVPDGMSDVKDPCADCGREIDIVYSGRGRRPKKCSSCKPVRAASASKSAPKVTGTAASLAAQAAESLCLINGFVAMGAMVTGFTRTGIAIKDREDVFKETVYQALLTDTALCKWILSGGVKGAKLALILAYASLGASVAPVALEELRDMRDARAERKAQGGL